MIQFEATIERFGKKGEKSGWTYIQISEEMANQLDPGNRKSFRIKGKMDNYSFSFLSLVPMGDGSFILPLNAEIRKKIKKEQGDVLKVVMEAERREKPLCQEFISCLEDDPAAKSFFLTLTKGHQRYFSNWIESAKTEATKTKRITQAIIALGTGLGYSEMIRMNKKSV